MCAASSLLSEPPARQPGAFSGQWELMGLWESLSEGSGAKAEGDAPGGAPIHDATVEASNTVTCNGPRTAGMKQNQQHVVSIVLYIAYASYMLHYYYTCVALYE